MKNSKRVINWRAAAVAFLPLLGGCGVAPDAEVTSEAEVAPAQTEEAITGGQLAPVGADPSVVKIATNGGGCTATKLTSKWWLTAEHCLRGVSAGDTMQVTNGASGAFDTVLTIERVEVHPTAFNDPNVFFTYDVGLVKSVESTTIPALGVSKLQSTYVNPGVSGILTAYGCDNNSSNDGQKQIGTFTITTRNNLGLDTFWSWAGAPPQVCLGDSGGPLFIRTDGVWRIAGVVTGGGNDPSGNPGSSFARTGNVRQWILKVTLNDPGYNDYGDSRRGFFINRLSNHCIGIDGASTANLALSKQNWCDGRQAGAGFGDHQYWRLNDMGNGQWRFRNMNSDKCLGVENGSTAANARLNQVTCSTSTSQLWTTIGSGTYRRLRNVKSSHCIHAVDGADGTVLVQGSCASATLGSNWVFSY